MKGSTASRPDATAEPGSVEERVQASDADVRPRLSVVVPVMERPEPLEEIVREYAPALESLGEPFEMIFVVPPWHTHLAEPLDGIDCSAASIRVLEVGQGSGEGVLLRLAARRARGDVILTLPAYHRVEASGLAKLVQAVEDGADLAVARRWPRRDSWINRLQSGVFNWLQRTLAGGDVRDVACGVRAGRRDVLLQLPLYGEFYRFLPLLAINEGYRIREVEIPQHPEDAQARVYGPGTYVRRLVDLLGIFFLARFTYKPLRFFGLVGSLIGGVGGVIMLVVFVQRLAGQPLADRPLLLLGVLLVTLGVQSFAIGLIGEIIVHLSASDRRRSYRLDDETEGRGR